MLGSLLLCVAPLLHINCGHVLVLVTTGAAFARHLLLKLKILVHTSIRKLLRNDKLTKLMASFPAEALGGAPFVEPGPDRCAADSWFVLSQS